MLNISELSPGDDPPEQINVVVEIPSGTSVKYELDLKTGAMFVDRFLYSAMHYPFNYGFIPQTKGGDGDPIDVAVIGQQSVFPMSVIRARPIGVLLMEDESGPDPKIIAIPSAKIDPLHEQFTEIDHLHDFTRNQIEDFFKRYKDLEPKKFVKIIGWKGPEVANERIMTAIAASRKNARGKLRSQPAPVTKPSR
jgi:inorganic pyrophosphatase